MCTTSFASISTRHARCVDSVLTRRHPCLRWSPYSARGRSRSPLTPNERCGVGSTIPGTCRAVRYPGTRSCAGCSTAFITKRCCPSVVSRVLSPELDLISLSSHRRISRIALEALRALALISAGENEPLNSLGSADRQHSR